MSDNMKVFLEAVSKNQNILNSISIMTEKADIIAVASKMGFELTEADFDVSDNEMSDTELSAVTGGTLTCVCPMVGGGTSSDGLNTPCACIAGGGGVDYDNLPRCACVLYGIGEDLWV